MMHGPINIRLYYLKIALAAWSFAACGCFFLNGTSFIEVWFKQVPS